MAMNALLWTSASASLLPLCPSYPGTQTRVTLFWVPSSLKLLRQLPTSLQLTWYELSTLHCHLTVRRKWQWFCLNSCVLFFTVSYTTRMLKKVAFILIGSSKIKCWRSPYWRHPPKGVCNIRILWRYFKCLFSFLPLKWQIFYPGTGPLLNHGCR